MTVCEKWKKFYVQSIVVDWQSVVAEWQSIVVCWTMICFDVLPHNFLTVYPNGWLYAICEKKTYEWLMDHKCKYKNETNIYLELDILSKYAHDKKNKSNCWLLLLLTLIDAY